LVDTWAPGRRFFNLYGPTESTIWASFAECLPGGGKPLIGRPVANTRLYLLDRHFEPVPVGVAGELFIGGAGVARGYLNQPELTAERFVPDGFSGEAGGRLYRTGDLCRWGEAGELEFLGRLDHQVKVRGFRIELGEVEAALRASAMVQEAVVLAREETPGEKRLVAYVVGSNGALSTTTLREHLKERLPEYMVPSAFVELAALPLTASGKVDRKALPAPEGLRPELESRYEAPRTPMEAALAQIWSEVLRVEQVGIHDNFFELGGHSLLVTQLVSRVRDNLGFEIAVHGVFDNPTVAGMAETLGGASSEGLTDGGTFEALLPELESLSDDEVRRRLSAFA
jgi:hypothetical protein